VKKVVAYLTTGYPDKQFTRDLVFELSQHIDTLELGIPFSDPVADGETIEKANLLALKNGVTFNDVLDVARDVEMPTYLMGYFNSFYNRGIDNIFKELNKNAISGAIIPDLPHEESQIYLPKFEESHLDLIPFIAPTDGKERISEILQNRRTRFIYLVAYAGITGSGKSEDLNRVIADIKSLSKCDLFVGFGVNELTAKEKSKNVDGVIVGSAFVKHLLNESTSHSEKISRIVNSARIIREEINS
jgi:tryptophan synthase alpha chain